MAKASVLCILVVLTSSFLIAQTDSESNVAREKLNYFAGTWNIEMHMSNGALKSRTFLSTERNEWSPGHLLLLSNPGGETALPEAGLAVMGYSTAKHVYTYHILKTSGEADDLQGTVEDRTWTWLSSDGRTDGEPAKTRITMKEISTTSYMLRVETFAAPGEWTTVMEGTAKKVLVHSHQDVAFVR